MRYPGQKHVLLAVDCILFGFDGSDLRLLLIQRAMAPQKHRWSLMGGFLHASESLEQAANRVLQSLTGLHGVYMRQMHTFSNPLRDPAERTVSTAFFALIDIHRYEKQLTQDFHAEWFLTKKLPPLIFDHARMVAMAQNALRYHAALHPVLFELLPHKFTLPRLQKLYEAVYDERFDTRNFSRKVLSTGLLIKQVDKDKQGSKRGAFFYKLDRRKYRANLPALLTLIPHPEKFLRIQDPDLL